MCVTYHDHGRAREDAHGDQKSAAVADGALVGDEEHNVAAHGDEGAHGHDGPTGADLVRHDGGGEDGDKGAHVGWDGEELGRGGVVAHALDDAGQEHGEALHIVSRLHYKM